MKKLSITILDFDDIKNPLLGAGQAWATYEVGQRLTKRGHKITVISSRFPNSKDRYEKGIYYRHIGLGSKNIKLNNLVYILMINFYVMRLKTDIILECFTAPISTLLSPLFTKIPVVALPSMFAAKEFSKKYHLPFYLIESFGSRFYKYFLPYSKFIDIQMKKMNPNIKSKIVPEGVAESFFRIKRRKPRHILFLGRFDMDQKGIDLLLESYSKISNKISYPLVIAGHGPDEKKIISLIKALNLQSRVKLVGSAYGLKKMKLLQQAICVAFPSRRETFSLFALEALASAVPVVAFSIPQLSWMDSKSALKAKSFQKDEYALLLKKITSAKRNIIMSKNARIFASHFSWDIVAEKFEDFFYYIYKHNYEIT